MMNLIYFLQKKALEYYGKIDISIVIRTKNEERWIKRCIDKIQNQKIAKNFEIIIVDSGSSDKTIEKGKRI